jgi:hypothetical protein
MQDRSQDKRRGDAPGSRAAVTTRTFRPAPPAGRGCRQLEGAAARGSEIDEGTRRGAFHEDPSVSVCSQGVSDSLRAGSHHD